MKWKMNADHWKHGDGGTLINKSGQRGMLTNEKEGANERRPMSAGGERNVDQWESEGREECWPMRNRTKERWPMRERVERGTLINKSGQRRMLTTMRKKGELTSTNESARNVDQWESNGREECWPMKIGRKNVDQWDSGGRKECLSMKNHARQWEWSEQNFLIKETYWHGSGCQVWKESPKKLDVTLWKVHPLIVQWEHRSGNSNQWESLTWRLACQVWRESCPWWRAWPGPIGSGSPCRPMSIRIREK